MDNDNQVELSRLNHRVQEFLNLQPQYNKKVNLKITLDEGRNFFILYGRDVSIGVIGLGQTEENAYDSFVENWIYYYRNT